MVRSGLLVEIYSKIKISQLLHDAGFIGIFSKHGI